MYSDLMEVRVLGECMELIWSSSQRSSQRFQRTPQLLIGHSRGDAALIAAAHAVALAAARAGAHRATLPAAHAADRPKQRCHWAAIGSQRGRENAERVQRSMRARAEKRHWSDEQII
jgi:hypothetical protein